jgi:hypothetical protein
MSPISTRSSLNTFFSAFFKVFDFYLSFFFEIDYINYNYDDVALFELIPDGI